LSGQFDRQFHWLVVRNRSELQLGHCIPPQLR
jgi:hypothetical protein